MTFNILIIFSIIAIAIISMMTSFFGMELEIFGIVTIVIIAVNFIAYLLKQYIRKGKASTIIWLIATVGIASSLIWLICTTYTFDRYEMIANDDGRTATVIQYNYIGDTIHIDNVRMPINTSGKIIKTEGGKFVPSPKQMCHKQPFIYTIRWSDGSMTQYKTYKEPKTSSRSAVKEEKFYPRHEINIYI